MSQISHENCSLCEILLVNSFVMCFLVNLHSVGSKRRPVQFDTSCFEAEIRFLGAVL